MNEEEKELYSFSPQDDQDDEPQILNTPSPTTSIHQTDDNTQDAWTQTGLMCTEASPVSDFDESPLPSPTKIFNIDSDDEEPEPKKTKLN